MSCTYIYRGREYTRVDILKGIKDGKVSMPLDKTAARKWLLTRTGLAENQLEIVSGMVAEGVFGRFLADGKIILGDELHGVHFHEGLHRVIETLTEGERTDIFNEMKSRKNYPQMVQDMRERYPEINEEDLINEMITEEFTFFMLNDGDYNIPTPKTKSLFQQILDFFKALFNKGKEVLTLQEFYDNVEKGEYAHRAQSTYRSSPLDMRLGDRAVDPAVTQELTNFIAMDMIRKLLDEQSIFELLDETIDITDLYIQTIDTIVRVPQIDQETGEQIEGYAMADTNPDLALQIFNDTFTEQDELRPDSALFARVVDYLRTLNVKLTGKTMSETENSEDNSGDYAFMKVSFEYDPGNSISRAMRLMFAALPNRTKDFTLLEGKYTSLPQAVPDNEVIKKLFTILDGVPNDYAVIYEEISKRIEDYPELDDLLDWMGDPNVQVTPYLQRLRSNFTSSMVRHQYKFLKGILRDGEFQMMNLGNESQQSKFIQLWRNRLEMEYVGEAEDLIADLSTDDVKQLARVMGFEELIDENLLNETLTDTTTQTAAERLVTLSKIAIRALENGIAPQHLYDRHGKQEYEILGSVEMLANMAAQKAAPFDLMMINGERKRIYAITLHTYQSIVLGRLNWIARSGQSREQRLEMIQEWAPQVLHTNTLYKDQVLSFYLDRILNGEQLKLEVFDAVGYQGIDLPGHKLGATDILAQSSNALFKGHMFALRHGDRSTVFSYRLESGRTPITTLQESLIIDQAIHNAQKYLIGELNAYKTLKKPKNFAQGKGMARVKATLHAFDFLPPSTMSKKINQPAKLLEASYTRMETYFKDLVDETYTYMEQEGLFAQGSSSTHPVGIDKNVFQELMEANSNDPVQAKRAFAAISAMNHFLLYQEQLNLFTGEMSQYAGIADYFKRIQMSSSTGKGLQTGSAIDDYIEIMNRQDQVQLRDPLTGQIADINYNNTPLKVMGAQSEIVLQEESFTSPLVDTVQTEASPIDGKPVSVLQYVMELQSLEELNSLYGEKEEHKKIARRRAMESVNAYTNFDENDGSSWINIFYWREFMVRSEQWTHQLENAFQIEIAVLNNHDELKDTVVYVDEYKERILHRPVSGYTEVRIFDLQDIQDKIDPRRGALSWYKDVADHATMLKPQYMGPVFDQESRYDPQRINAIAGRKTAFQPLIPSVIRGSKLEQLQATMIRQGIDSAHMSTSAKFGHRELSGPGTGLYDEAGMYAQDIEEHAASNVTYLDLAYQKNQLSVKSKPKNKIKNATQSVKIMLADMMNNGIPRDINISEVNWDDLTEKQRLEISPIYRLLSNYRSALYDAVRNAARELTKELGQGYTELNKLVDILRRSALDRNEARYILDAIEDFAQTGRLEQAPNYQRIENILYSIVSNNVISLKRPGDGKPQTTSSLWEPISQARTKTEEGWLSNPLLKFHEITLKDGKVNKVSAAQIIIPLPPKWIPKLLRWAKTRNIVEAVELYNKSDSKILLKSLRIPNQQFSFNHALEIKEFRVPTMQSYVVVPSEMVVKEGGDFDVDKQFMYFPEINNQLQPVLIGEKGKEDSEEGLLARFNAFRQLERIEYEDEVVMYDGEEVDLSEVEQSLRENIQEIVTVRNEMFNRYSFTDSNSDLHQVYADEIENLRVLYGARGESIHEIMTDAVDRLQSSWNDASETERMFMRRHTAGPTDLTDEYNRMLEIIRGVQKIVDPYRESDQEKLDAIKSIQADIQVVRKMMRENELKAFKKKYPTVLDQIHSKVLHNELLGAELDILLAPQNASKTLASNDESWFKNDLFEEMMSLKEGKKVNRSNRDEFIIGKQDSKSLFGIPANNQRAIRMTESKSNVGLVATAITTHHIAQVDGLQLSPTYFKRVNDEQEERSSKLPLTEGSSNLGQIHDEELRNIVEVLSVSLTLQVDGIKDPIAPVLGLSSQTLAMVSMLNRRGVSMKTIIALTLNPTVQEYLRMKRVNNSTVWRSQPNTKGKSVRIPNAKFIGAVLSDLNLDGAKYEEIFDQMANGIYPTLDQKSLLDLLRTGKQSEEALAAFIYLEDLNEDYAVYMRDMTPDTKTKKNRSELINVVENRNKLSNSALLQGNLPHLKGFMQPFFENAEEYFNFLKYYILPTKQLDFIATIFTKDLYNEEQINRVHQKVLSDFMVYVLQNFTSMKKFSVSQLMSGENSAVRQLMQLDHPVVEALTTILNNGQYMDQELDNIRLTQRGLPTPQMNDVYDSVRELPDIAQDFLIALSLFQSGMHVSRYTLREILPVELIKPYLDELNEVLQRLPQDHFDLDKNTFYGDFLRMFYLNNPQLLPRSRYQAIQRKLPVYSNFDEATSTWRIHNVEGKTTFRAMGSTNSPAVLNYQRAGFGGFIAPMDPNNDPSSDPIEQGPGYGDTTSDQLNAQAKANEGKIIEANDYPYLSENETDFMQGLADNGHTDLTC